MAFSFGNKIVTDGLAIYLDPANVNSYVGSGTSLYDIFDKSIVGTLVNNPIYSTKNAGDFLFNGSNQYISFANNPLSSFTTLTYDCWFKLDPTETTAFLISGTSLMVYIQNQDTWFISGLSGNKSFSWTFNSNWNNIVIATNASVTTAYINGVSITVNTGAGLSSQAEMQIAGRNFNSYLNGNIAAIKIYNKILSATEIQQNYNALKSRFGL